jgi:hypothetical protein
MRTQSVMSRLTYAAVLTVLLCTQVLATTGLSPCEAYGAADGVFIGVAQPMVQRRVSLAPPQPPIVQYTVTPFVVERAFRGVASPVVYIMPTGGSSGEFPPGQRFLVYGHSFEGTDMFMSTFSYGTKLLSDAMNDLEFLDVVGANAIGATIFGRVELKDLDPVHNTTITAALPGIAVTLTADERAARVLTSGDGYFTVSGLPSGTYKASVELPSDLASVKEPQPIVDVRSGGCASLLLGVVPNGRIHGIMRTVEGQPARFQSVALMRGPLMPNGPDGYIEQVDTDADGRFVIVGVPPGIYALGHLSANVDGVVYPSVYYPGTLDRKSAVPIVVGRSTEHDLGEFVVPRRSTERP